ncbi:MAG: tetratricopeptide repeat protein, partial [Candidatus Cloacimonetes bacterium]|nr:tetratricopeptide repeat protein [Candidatus Cloacimonadota bacterium]
MTKKLLFASLLIVLLITSCGIDNTMFNARKYFKQAQDRPLTSSGRPSPQAVDEYTKTIQKCGVIITEKKGKKTLSEAVFLLARALYYKGNSAFQAKDQFEALINGFPESRHVPEAHIYLARVLRQLNRKQEAEKLLEGFVRDTRHQKSHPRTLMVLAEFEIEDQDFLSAQYWLQRIITDYPKSSEFKEASFLFGKNYYEQHDYLSSFKEFEKLVNTRGINKELKLEGRYYMALSLFELGEYAKCDKLVSQLLKSESRLDKLALIRVIKARLLLQGNDEEKGINEVDEIAKLQPRSLASSAAYYYLADYYFYQNADIELAGTTYGKVRTEFPTAIYADYAKQKADAVNQIKQNKNLSAKANLQQYVDYHMLAAENYLNAFALNDSALVMYQRILDVAAPFKVELDSLTAVADSINARVDSLQIQIAELEALIPEPPAPADSLESQELIPDMETEAVADSVDAVSPPDEAEEAEEDGEEITEPDLIDEPEQLSAEPDSGETSEEIEEETPEELPLDIPEPEEEEEPILDPPLTDEEE